MASARTQFPHLAATPSESAEATDEEDHDPDSSSDEEEHDTNNSSHAGVVLMMILRDLNKYDVKNKLHSGTSFYDDTSEKVDQSVGDESVGHKGEEYVHLEKEEELGFGKREESISMVENTDSARQVEGRGHNSVSWDRPDDSTRLENRSQRKMGTSVDVVSAVTFLT